MNDLTILLTLKGRKSFTKRWLDWMALEKCPYKIMLADGDADKSYTEALIKNTNYRDLDIDHIKFQEDKDIQTFIKKFNEAVSLIKTKYAIYADNDDFLIIDNLKKALLYFKKNSELQTLALPHYRFSIKNNGNNVDSNLYSDGDEVAFQVLRPVKNRRFDDYRPLQRLLACIKYFPGDYFVYAIHKTENFKKFMRITVDYPIEYIFFWERHFTYSVGVVGNIGTGVTLDPFLVRQEDTSMLASSLVEKEKLINIRYSAAWKRQYPDFVNGLYKLVKEYDNINQSKFNFYVRAYFGLNTQIRIFQGLVGSIFRPFASIYTVLSKFVLWRLGKSRITLDQDNVSKNANLRNLSNFLNNTSR